MGRKIRYVQTQNPRSGNWVKIDKDQGIILGHKEKPWKNVKKAEK